jgi:hypothetical protein
MREMKKVYEKFEVLRRNGDNSISKAAYSSLDKYTKSPYLQSCHSSNQKSWHPPAKKINKRNPLQLTANSKSKPIQISQKSLQNYRSLQRLSNIAMLKAISRPNCRLLRACQKGVYSYLLRICFRIPLRYTRSDVQGSQIVAHP